MKKSILAIVTLTLGFSALADNCEKQRSYYSRDYSPHECATMAASGVAAVGSGIYSAKKYKNAKLFEKENTKILFQQSGEARIMESRRGQSYSTQAMDGDKMTVLYELNEVQNREYHINLMESNAASADSRAAMHLVRSTTAMKSQKVGNSTIPVPDLAARAAALAMYTSEKANAADYRAKARDARMGGKVPTYTLTEVIDEKVSNAKKVQDFIDERFHNESKIKEIRRLPAKQYRSLKSMVNKGRAGIVGAVAMTGLLIEEAVAGKVAEKLEENDIGFEINLEKY